MDAERFNAELAGCLKPLQFRKSNATWRKDMGECIAVLNVQKSSWGDGGFYVNVGLYFKALGADASPTENVCHIQERLPVRVPELVASSATSWFAERATLERLRALHQKERLKGKGLVMKVLLDALGT